MAHICLEGQYMDRLLRNCMPCSKICHDSRQLVPRCSQYCVAWSCKAVSGQFYDTLLKKCLKCSELCGTHPEACADACRSRGAEIGTQRPLLPGRGRPVSGSALYSEALLYSLLGLCIIVLMFTLTAAVLLLLKRAAQESQQQLDTKKQQPNKLGQSSEDSLMARSDEVTQEGSVTQERPRATETCVYCFSEHSDPLHTHRDKSRALRIICSPTQTSM
ncbi:tumor necrosis factor receptor superfamily member 13B [Puntigrus tetrazona]|uniref:tumor necrosis factor receptor superfamily member 13B n=1 Tax=Puntigrus tetrazona TaxID=1606681 RepID=UPI001C8B011D|nr:tumor necrosis factor receptor superfamily member 13B [Puntigrus tetrazona]